MIKNTFKVKINTEDCEQVTIRDVEGGKKKRILREGDFDEQQDDDYEDTNENEDSY